MPINMQKHGQVPEPYSLRLGRSAGSERFKQAERYAQRPAAKGSRGLLSLLFCASVMLPAIDAAASRDYGQATVTRGGTTYEFIVTQCLREVKNPFSGVVIEFQLDGVPPGTSEASIEQLVGEMGPDTDVMAVMLPVVENGPILTVTRVAEGGDLLSLSNLADLAWISEGDPMESGSRFLEIGDEERGATVSGTVNVNGETTRVEATCPP